MPICHKLTILNTSLINQLRQRKSFPNGYEIEGTVVAVNVRHPQCAALPIGRAMHDNHRYFPHKMFFYYPQMLNRFETEHLSIICLTSAEQYNPQIINRFETEHLSIICLTSADKR